METIVGINPTIIYYPNGNKQHELWYINGSRHREDGPAYIWYYETGQVKRESWYFNGQYHRADGAALIEYYKSGIMKEYWFINSKVHRIEGPAITVYHRSSEIKEELWYLDGKESNHKEWLIDNNLYNKPYNTWTDEEKVLWRLQWV